MQTQEQMNNIKELRYNAYRITKIRKKTWERRRKKLIASLSYEKKETVIMYQMKKIKYVLDGTYFNYAV